MHLLGIIPFILTAAGILNQAGCSNESSDSNRTKKVNPELEAAHNEYQKQCQTAQSTYEAGCELYTPDSVSTLRSQLERRACFFRCETTTTFSFNGKKVSEYQCKDLIEENLNTETVETLTSDCTCEPAPGYSSKEVCE